MEQRKRRMTILASLLSAVAVTVTIAFIGLGGERFPPVRGFFDPPVWNHYAAVEATESTHGSREFWANCTDLGFVLEEPTTGKINEGVAFDTTAFFDELPFGDTRYVPSLEKQRAMGMLPVLADDGKTLTYGLYPRSAVSDGDLLAELNALGENDRGENGWYVCGEDYYVPLTAAPYKTDYHFSNGESVITGETYWFKCEPIVWNVLADYGGGEYQLFSKYVLDFHAFHSSSEVRVIGGDTVYPNVYKHSDARSYLNDEFLKTAFAFGDSFIETSYVGNGAYSTNPGGEPFVTGATHDKLFLPSVQELTETAFGFDPGQSFLDNARQGLSTDYGMALGLGVDGTLGTAHYLTRSPMHNKYWDYPYGTAYYAVCGRDINHYTGTHRPGQIFLSGLMDGKAYQGIRPEMVVKLTSGEPSPGPEPEPAPEFSVDLAHKTVEYGVYPQTLVDDPKVLRKLNTLGPEDQNEQGWYFYNGAYYVSLRAANQASYYFHNDTPVVNGNVYWFKCEPILWDIVADYGYGEYYLLSHDIIGMHAYRTDLGVRVIDEKTVYANNYEHSDVRAYLTGDFLKSAFVFDDSHLMTTKVGNGEASTRADGKPFAGNSTHDKVFLPSFQELTNASLGFNQEIGVADTLRQAGATDYDKAIGLNCGFGGTASYITRSPVDASNWGIAYGQAIVDIAGSTGKGSALHTDNVQYCGLRPAIFVKDPSFGPTPDLIPEEEPEFSIDLVNKKVEYGLYPQSLVDDYKLLRYLNQLGEDAKDEHGYYAFNGAHYVCLRGNPLVTSYFDNGWPVLAGALYWFKCEPIEWRILESNAQGEHLLISEQVLDNHAFNASTEVREIDDKAVYSNNYEYSDVRAWLNEEFLQAAFGEDDSHLVETMVKNDASTTLEAPENLLCNDTQDMVFLPSEADLVNGDYGFYGATYSSSASRKAPGSEYVRANNGFVDGGFAYYATRSPTTYADTPYGEDVFIVANSGAMYAGQVFLTSRCGIRPMVTVKVSLEEPGD